MKPRSFFHFVAKNLSNTDTNGKKHGNPCTIRTDRFAPNTVMPEHIHILENPEMLLQALRPLHQEGYIWALRLAKSDENLASDVLQAVYLKILEQRAVFRGDSSLKTWFFSVIKFTLSEQRRPLMRLVHTETETASEEIAQDLEMVDSEHTTIWKRLFEKLSEKQQEVVSLVFYHRATIEEAAVVMGISVGTARTHYERAKINLRSLIYRFHLLDELKNP